MKKYLLLIPLAFLLTFCNLNAPVQPTPDVALIVDATLTAVAAGPQGSPGETGGISGRLGYPADSLPAMRVVAIQVATGQYYSVDTAAGQDTYRLDDLAEGKYNVLAYTLGGGSFPAGLAGGYTQAVMCGMGEACTEHGLVDVIVFGGEITPDIDIIDWLQPSFPPMPGDAPVIEAPASVETGSVAGALMFPSSTIPPLRVAAFNLETGVVYTVDIVAGQASYQIDKLPPGRYFVVAYALDSGFAGGYTAAVPCGLSADCNDHSLLEVPVRGNSLTQNITPGDFYAPEGTFPPMP
jgi:hypothetical protein